MIDEEYIKAKVAEYKAQGILSYMRCSVTGKETFCKMAFPSRIKKFRDIEDCLRHWVSREGRLIQKGLTPSSKPKKEKRVSALQENKKKLREAKKALNIKRKQNHFAKATMPDGQMDYFWRRPGFLIHKPEKTIIDLSVPSDTTKELTQNMCWRPDIYLDNDKHCNNCPMFSACHYYGKRLLKQSSFSRGMSSRKYKTRVSKGKSKVL